ncbi:MULTISPECIES: ABC transporter ATP-binding protein [Paracoccus]|uniref:ABC transporter ATP-binding protein n=1 Tax=Paracoccus TaxID=265 RepID=UPI0005DB9A76|nr:MULTISPECIES: ABC transporter ATP-binding protein [Paracoccus]AZY93302.1 ABC transporter ATP-binding protein [Paracoccus sp. Arc7-R13]KIX18432.1 ABC transporter ATP-binding protein [Paracoccus sp. 228]QXI64571.1 High-affinity branched-chain amino acid transport ATP-binding protein LivF [Paracoccus marcusii]TNB99868.1 ABC transporter ATP-binding protein [Paracoccus marcusii]|tara:strand:- start:5741 stop:6427 length:687 start_codon:yes stop_codon:yes gene_type:complete
MLVVEGLQAGYGEAQVLHDIHLSVGQGQVVTLLGRNGMGKTTTISTIFGLLAARGGRVSIDGRDVTRAAPHRIARAGLGLVPEGRQVFPTLDVRENLIATARPGHWTLSRVLELFPRLSERMGHKGSELSGGEQQMLAIGRALMTNPRLIVLDEATEGLAPLIRDEIWSCLTRLKDQGEAILIVDKNLSALTRFADHHVVIEKGRTVWSGDNAQLLNDSAVAERHLGV